MSAEPDHDAGWQDNDICAASGEDVAWQLGAPNTPIFESSLFTFPTLAELHAGLGDGGHTYVYQRGLNPTVGMLQDKLARLERCEAAKCFGSGMGAISAVVMAHARSGGHVVIVGDVYAPARNLLEYLAKFGVGYSLVDGRDLDALDRAIGPETDLVYFESPTSGSFDVVDIAAVADLARSRGVVSAIDSTWSSPLFCKPHVLGVDLVIHSASKYLGGHSDLVGGVVAGTAEHIDALAAGEYWLLGSVMTPTTASRIMRGLRTMPVRMKAHSAGGLAVAQFLAEQPGVFRVLHPGLPEHPGHEVARAQFAGYGGLFGIELATDRVADVHRFVDSLRHFRTAISWGGFESLVSTDADPMVTVQGRRVGRVRLFVGLEPPEQLMADVAQALRAAGLADRNVTAPATLDKVPGVDVTRDVSGAPDVEVAALG